MGLWKVQPALKDRTDKSINARVSKCPNMSNRIKTLKCPHCGYSFEAVGGDNSHSYCSIKKPLESEVVNGSIKEQLYDCANPRCRNPITVYWFEPKRSFPVV